MPYLCLLLSGAALLINGLAALGRIPLRDSAVFSLLIGTTQLVLGAVYAGTAGGGDPRLLPGASGMILFGLTYLYVGLDVLLQLGSKGLGWFSGLVGAFGILLAMLWFPDDPLLSVLWLSWAFLWILFFVRLALGCEGLAPFIGWALVLTSQVTATIPAFVGLVGHWPYDRGIAGGTAAAVGVLLVVAGVLGRRQGQGPAAWARPEAAGRRSRNSTEPLSHAIEPTRTRG
ncbi:AmiS/UreI family transporter [Arthrobacter sp. SO3]|uniref:AmiS/UreI family transporter n=1 Tax=Arthrobacter sp. SO3 TaxID=1897057 RepID=UPI001CFFD292|nr:AmiS/UreI family transporter [Arthrobacter sp. SO3]MCB5291599.1 Acid-activated urea channel [Arthrobacter sp. SO3]